jgi:ribosomal protein S18 acetylase RimI-like enzyme
LVGLAHFESGPGEAFLQVHPDHAYLKPEMLDYAESALSREKDGKRQLALCVNTFDRELKDLARSAGFRPDGPPDATTQLEIGPDVPALSLPDGFSLTDRAETNDLHEINRVLWRGFNHEGPAPEQYVAGRADVEKAPLYRPELTVMVQAPDGHLVSYCGVWYVPANRLAYVEPVATDPGYRRRGLGTAAVLEAIRRAGLLSATRAIVGSGLSFYRSLGFQSIYTTIPWHKQVPGTRPPRVSA